MSNYVMFDSFIDALCQADYCFDVIEELCNFDNCCQCHKDSNNCSVDSESHKQVQPKTLYIESVRFNYPATVVRWSDNTKTTAVHDKLKKCNHIYADEKSNRLVYTYPEDPKDTYHTENLADWKATGFTYAIVKKLVPNYFHLLDKWCN